MSHHWGYVAAVSSAVLFGMGATLNKIVLADVDPTVTAGLIYFFAGITLLFVRFSPFRSRVMNSLKTPTKTEPKICRRDFVVLALVIISGSILAPLFFLNGLNQTTAVNASLLQNTECLFTVLIAIVFLKEIANRKEWISIALIV